MRRTSEIHLSRTICRTLLVCTFVGCGAETELNVESDPAAIELSSQAFILPSVTAPAVGRDPSTGMLLVAYTKVVSGQRDIFTRLMNANGSAAGAEVRITDASLEDFDPSVAGGNGQFLVSFTRAFSSSDSDPMGSLVSASTGNALGVSFNLDSSSNTLHGDVHAVFIPSQTRFLSVFRSETVIFSKEVLTSGASQNQQTVATRPNSAGVRRLTLAHSPTSLRLLLGWTNVRTESVELATRLTTETVWSNPSQTTWPQRSSCSDSLGPVSDRPNCLAQGEFVSVAFNAGKFGVAFGNDSNVGANVQAVLLPETCRPGPGNCTATLSRKCASSTGCVETNKLFDANDPATPANSLGSVAIAGANQNFAIAFLHEQGSPDGGRLSVVGMNGTGQMLATSVVATQPSAVKDPFIMNASLVNNGNQAALSYRLTFDTIASTPVQLAVMNDQGSVFSAQAVSP